ncbi:DUF1631 family protein [Pseudaquabacterium rugosum]|uniref:DUF1631 family protein n=1 Tax=Pseudaquabacterium rugosum TaxID=2984194 RepID=A0ABU9B4J4_9BURK
MASSATPAQLARRARRTYIEQLLKGLSPLVMRVSTGARTMLDKPAERMVMMRRRDLVDDLAKHASAWHKRLGLGLKALYEKGNAQPGRAIDLPDPSASLSLVDNDTIEREILTSRLALAMMDRASWEFSDLRSRIVYLEQRGELDTHDLLRAHALARVALDAWRNAGLSADGWREAQHLLHQEFAALLEEAYHEANRWLAGHKVLQEIDLRPFIRRQDNHAGGAGVGGTTAPHVTGPTSVLPGTTSVFPPGQGDDTGSTAPLTAGRQGPRSGHAAWPGVGDETRLMTRAAPLARGPEQAEAVVGRLNQLVGRHVPGFAKTSHAPRPVSPALAAAISNTQRSIQRRVVPAGGEVRGAGSTGGLGSSASVQTVLDDLRREHQALKAAANSPSERATIEIVAMMFQSILTEDRIPASVRVWFARLQMPVLRVAVSEPDFFANLDHPARRLIDRMGACVMGLDSAAGAVGSALEKEIKRVVQVVEAYPDTGNRVFQTVLVEFERFLEHFFRNEHEPSKRGVSLAQQVEQRETLAIQYTIELRRMLNEVPVQEGVRQFLFQVWADVMATAAVRYGKQSEETKDMKRAAADLIWSASAKVTREERAEVIRRLPLLLKRLKDGMVLTNMSPERQDERLTAVNTALAAAFTAKAAVIPNERMRDLKERLESLEELLPAAEDIQIDESLVLDLSGHESSELEVVSEGGTAPTAPMVAWARELLVGSWYQLEYRNRTENVQLAWTGLRRQLSLFVTTSGRCVLFQQQRLAAFLQAGLLLPVQEESLTVKATRTALAKLDADPSRLMAS